MSNILAWLIAVMLLAFLITRMHMFQHAYTQKSQEYNNNEWLVSQCSRDDFYHNMKHHSNICEDVTTSIMENIWLHSADYVVRNSYLCGHSSCLYVLERLMEWLMGSGFVLTVILLICVLCVPTLLLPLVRVRTSTMLDYHAHARLESPAHKQVNYCNPLGQHLL